jgi:uncharacterized membrane protein YkoI
MNLIKFGLASIAFKAVLLVSAAAAEEPPATLLKQAKVTEEQATKIASAKVPDGTVKSSELEREHGKLIWSFDIARPGSRAITEIQVDAKTGKIVSLQTESVRDQAKEAKADKASGNQ